MAAAVFCTAINEAQATAIVGELRFANVPPDEISVLLPDRGPGREDEPPPPQSTAGAARLEVGGILGGALDWLTAAGGIALPGFGPFIGAGPIMAQIAPPAAEGGNHRSHGVRRVLTEMGMPEYEAQILEGRLREGGVLIAVHADDERRRETARAVFEREGAEDISIAGEVAIGGGRRRDPAL